MPDAVLAHRNGETDDEAWRLSVNGREIDFSDKDEWERAARMISGPGTMLVIDRREDCAASVPDLY